MELCLGVKTEFEPADHTIFNLCSNVGIQDGGAVEEKQFEGLTGLNKICGDDLE